MGSGILETPPGARNVYTRGFLSLELPHYARTLDERDFTQFQCERLREVVPMFSADTLSVSVLVFDPDGTFQRSSYVGRHRVPEDTYQKYLEFKHLDVMIGLNRQFRGTAIFNTDYLDFDDWRNHAFYDGFMRPTGRYHSAIVSYPYPFKSELELRFNFQTMHPNTFGAGLHKDIVEYINLPFYIAWLFRLNAIDDQVMTRWLSSLTELSLFEVKLLRKLSAVRGFGIQDAASALSSDTAKIEETLYAIASHAPSSSRHPPEGSTNYEWLLNLGRRYDFLQHSGEFVPREALLRSISKRYANGYTPTAAHG